MQFWNLAVIQKKNTLLSITNFWAMYSYLLCMFVVELLSDCSYRSVFSKLHRKMKLRTNKWAIFFLVLTIHQIHILSLLSVSKCKWRENATDLQGWKWYKNWAYIFVKAFQGSGGVCGSRGGSKNTIMLKYLSMHLNNLIQGTQTKIAGNSE